MDRSCGDHVHDVSYYTGIYYDISPLRSYPEAIALRWLWGDAALRELRCG
jgi:hypothetical protein